MIKGNFFFWKSWKFSRTRAPLQPSRRRKTDIHFFYYFISVEDSIYIFLLQFLLSMIKGNFFFWKSWKFSREREREKGGSAARTVLFSNCPPSIVVALLYYSRTRKDEYKERERSLDDLHACSGGEGGGVAALTDGSCATTPPEISSSDCSPKKFLRLPSILLIASE